MKSRGAPPKGRPAALKAKAKAKAKAETAARRSEAARKGWETRRATAREIERLAKVRSERARKGWITRKKRRADEARQDVTAPRRKRRKAVADYVEAMWRELGGDAGDYTVSDLYDLYYGYGEST